MYGVAELWLVETRHGLRRHIEMDERRELLLHESEGGPVWSSSRVVVGRVIRNFLDMYNAFGREYCPSLPR